MARYLTLSAKGRFRLVTVWFALYQHFLHLSSIIF
nr:MAG TPA: hypothetical protein [Caudoviricetes sp.]